MSTNIEHNGLPDIKLLEELANNFFKQSHADKGIAQAEPLTSDPLAKLGPATGITSSLQGVADPFSDGISIPHSAGGVGITPGAINTVNAIDLNNQDQRIPETPFPGTGTVSSSVAGSGISPSAHKQDNEVDLLNPQTSLRDPHFTDSDVIPKSVGSGGRSPFDITAINHDQLFNTTGLDLLPDITTILAAIPSALPGAQLPYGTSSSVSEGAYYFLNDAGFENNKLPKVNTGSHNSSNGLPHPSFDVNFIKKDFPILQEQVNGKPLIWLDNAATTQKPKHVIDRLSYFYEHENSNIHRAAHELAARATDAYEGAREKVRQFLNAASSNEIVFVRGTTEAINLVAQTYGEHFLQKGDEIIISHLEHHANIVPWQQLAAKKGVKLRVIPVDDDGQILLDEYQKLLNAKTKLVSFTQVSNALGTVTPAKQIIDWAHANGSKVLLDGAQSVSHLKVDLQYLNPDFFVFSGHKIFGPTGIGVLYGKEELLNSLPPWQGGGNMIKDVTFEQTKFHDAPFRFEAGTGNIADAVGLGAALDYVNRLGIHHIHQYEHYLLQYGTHLLKQVPGLRLVGTAADKASVLSFTLAGYSNDEVGKELSKEGIAVRTGHHCAQPILRRFGLESTVRPSLAFYNTCSDVDALVAVLHRLKKK